MADDIERAADGHGRDGVGGQDGQGRHRKAAASSRRMRCSRRQVLHSRRPKADVGGHAGQCRQGNPGDHARAETEQDEQEHGVQEVGEPRRSAAANVRQAAGGDADAHRRAEDARAEVGDAVSASSPSASAARSGRCRPWKCSTTRDVIRILTEATNASPSAGGQDRR